MPEWQFKENKNKILVAVLVMVMLVGGFYALNHFILKGGQSSLSDEGLNSRNTIKIKKINLEKMDTGILNSEKFQSFKEFKINRPAISELKTGKKNPFEPN